MANAALFSRGSYCSTPRTMCVCKERPPAYSQRQHLSKQLLLNLFGSTGTHRGRRASRSPQLTREKNDPPSRRSTIQLDRFSAA